VVWQGLFQTAFAKRLTHSYTFGCAAKRKWALPQAYRTACGGLEHKKQSIPPLGNILCFFIVVTIV